MRLNLASASPITRVIRAARCEIVVALPTIDASLVEACDVVAAKSAALRGVRTRLYVGIQQPGQLARPGHMLTKLARDGVEIRRGVTVPRLAIVDGSIVILARNQSDYRGGALITEGTSLAAMLVRSLAVQQEEHDTAGDEKPDPLVLEVLQQLGKGAKDESAAREMGLAVRTYRRMVASILDRLDAQSRFQAGFLAARRGWL